MHRNSSHAPSGCRVARAAGERSVVSRGAAVFRCGVIAVFVAACAGRAATVRATAAPPPMLIGDFTDDYGSRYVISTSVWTQLPRAHYRIVTWHVAAQYAIAQNDSANPGEKGRWTRIDWMPFTGMAPYEWGYCYSAFNAESAAIAESTHVAHRETPRTGCNGFPFSRMKRAPVN